MTRKRRRMLVLAVSAVCLGSAAALMMSAFSSSMELFIAPADLAAHAPRPGRVFRIGGLVEAGSLKRTETGGHPSATFRVTDNVASVKVTYTGILPDLFREGQGIVALGTLRPDGHFAASEVLAKHDATYMPKDVVDALKKSGE
ncbi:MAG: cytochrome c maturation protein CcmE, partial [Rhodospirillales bacterium]|nr:cytochrome c maturation protein CcmE [Rhodospirillales bacterium]